jgi:hypothetical protein
MSQSCFDSEIDKPDQFKLFFYQVFKLCQKPNNLRLNLKGTYEKVFLNETAFEGLERFFRLY